MWKWYDNKKISDDGYILDIHIFPHVMYNGVYFVKRHRHFNPPEFAKKVVVNCCEEVKIVNCRN